MLDFKNLQFLSCSPCRPAVLLPRTKFRWNRTIGRWFMAKKAIFKMAAAAILNFKHFNFWSRDCNLVQYLMCTKFHQNRIIFHCDVAISRFWKWRPSAILDFTHLHFLFRTLVSIPFCFLVQNFAEIGQSVDELWPKKRFLTWRNN